MASRIEDYALIGNCETVALVSKDGSVDWLCLPRYDSAACFAALLGDSGNGRWRLAPEGGAVNPSRRYRGATLILETRFETPDGAVVVVDCMNARQGGSEIIRSVRGVQGRVRMRGELILRFEYGALTPWVTRASDGRTEFISGPDRLTLQSDVEVWGEDFRTLADFTLSEGERVDFVLTWSRSYRKTPGRLDVEAALGEIEKFWTGWSSAFRPPEPYGEIALRSALTLKSLAHWETGGLVAAGTTSLPEVIGGSRNWDYRFCWLRDATFTLYALIGAGVLAEARAWHRWLMRAAAGSPADLQIMYGVAGERRVDERELPGLGGYENSKPVRVGNAAAGQIQLDVFGEVLDAFYVSRKAGLVGVAESWPLEVALVDHLETLWREPDDGIWEVRGGRKHFTHSKVMAWVAFDRAIRSVEEFGLDGASVKRWRAARAAIHDEVCFKGFNAGKNAFTQSYGSSAMDASLLLLPAVGFLPPDDPRITGTIAAVERELLRDGLVYRYDTGQTDDGLAGASEGAFLPCSFWLADAYILQGRYREATELFERLLKLCNDVGLLSEEYDPRSGRQLGNFPQAFSHLALINTAHNLASARGPVKQRADRDGEDSK